MSYGAPQPPGQPAKKEKPPLHAFGEKLPATAMVTHIGVSSHSHNGLHTIDENVVVMASGDMVFFINYATGETIDTIHGPADGGIGAVAVHPTKTRFVYCEKSLSSDAPPRIVVCAYPLKKETHVMKNGAKQGFSACAFNPEGKLLATVATEPDFSITVWNWEQEAIVLRNKAFSADVYSVSFSPFSDTMLITSGSGHLKLWDMASTFTGLKLQGTVGKFGKVEISDISGYIATPDNKVVSGSELGTLLLWEAHLVKCELMRIIDSNDDSPSSPSSKPAAADAIPFATTTEGGGEGEAEAGQQQQPQPDAAAEEEDIDDNDMPTAAHFNNPNYVPTYKGKKLRKCHEGNIEVVKLIEDNKIVMTAGHDGYVRYWSFAEIDVIEPANHSHIVGIKMLKELFLGKNVKAKSVTLSSDRSHWVLLDEGGSIRTFPRLTYSQITTTATSDPLLSLTEKQSPPSGPLLEFFDGSIASVVASPTDRSVVVGGNDGTVRLYDTLNKHEMYRAAFESPVKYLQFLPASVGGKYGQLYFIAAFQNGAVRILKKCRDGFDVAAGWRPHSTALVGIAVSADAAQVYTAAADGTAFYTRLHFDDSDASDLKITVEPFGWCNIPEQSVPTSLEWSTEGDVCFFGFSTGMLLAVAPPAAKPNHDETFEFTVSYAGVGYRQKKKPPQKEKKLVINPNEQEESSSDEDEEDEDQGPWAINCIKRLPNGLGYVVAMEKEELAYTFALSIRYQNKLGPPPIPPTGVDPVGRVEEPGPNVAFRDLLPIGVALSQDEQTLLVTFAHGEVVMRKLSMLADVKSPVLCARQYHDSVEGRVNGMAVLFDNSALITVGSDGLIITHSFDAAGAVTAGRVNLITLPKCDEKKKAPRERPDATTTSSAAATVSSAESAALLLRSVEEQRRLEDHEAAEALAEGKRSVIKKKIHAVHKEYLEILAMNDAAVGGKKLSEEELVLDPELQRLLDLEKINRVEEASVEFSWRVAYKEQLLKQLREAFVDTMKYDRFAVESFDKTFCVTSIRTPAFTPAQQAKLEQLQNAIRSNLGLMPDESNLALGVAFNENDKYRPGGENEDGLRTPFSSPMGPATGGGDGANNDNNAPNYNSGEDADMGPPPADYNNSMNNTMNTTANSNMMKDSLGKNKALKSQLDKAEERKRERLERKKGLEELLSRKPKPTDVDPFLASEIRYAKEHMGDHVLKTAPEYRVPSALVPTAERKAKQLILLEHSINNLRSAFNEKLLALRDMKRNACQELNQDRQRLAEIIQILNLDESELPAVFDLEPIEEPEKRFEIGDQALRKWAKERAKEQRRLEAQQRANKGFGADLASGEDEKQLGSEDDSDAEEEGGGKMSVGRLSLGPAQPKRASRLSGGHRESTFVRKPSLLSLKEKLEMDLKVRLENVRLGELEEEEAIIQRETLLYEKGRLIRRMEAAKKSYDEKLLEFLQERMRLEADICMADTRALLLFREFRMLLSFQKKDEELEQVRDVKLAEQNRINQRIKSISTDIDATKDRQLLVNEGFIANRQEAELHIKTAFPIQDQPYLLEVFNRKIKRVKLIDNDDDDDDAPTSSEDEEEDTTGDDFVEARPPTCDEAPWLQLLQLREGRLDLEDAQHDLKQKFTEFDKLLTKVKDKERVKVEKELAESRKAIDDFQLEKQRQLNLLETIVVLKLSQIQCLDDNRKVAHDLQKAPVIVFTETSINQLRSRIAELAEEKHELVRKSEQLQRSKQALLRRKAKRQLEHADWEQRVAEVQLLKFGQKVDLEALENLAVDRETEELKQQLKMEEVKWEREFRKQENRVKALKFDHQSRIGENTMLLKDLGNVREEQQFLEHALTTSTQKIVGKMSGGSKVATAADRAQLKDLVVRQQQEIDMLNNEATMLKRKGGHVYTPVIQRLQQQGVPEAFNSSMPATSATAASSCSAQQQQPHFNNSYSHPSVGGVGGAHHHQQPSSAPSSQQQQQQKGGGGGGGGGGGIGGISGQRVGGTAAAVVRPTVLSQSARQPTSTSTAGGATSGLAVGSAAAAAKAKGSPPSPPPPPAGESSPQ